VSAERPWEDYSPDDFTKFSEQHRTSVDRPVGDVVQLDWRRTLQRRGDRIVGNELNVLAALRTAPDLVGLVRYNEFAIRAEFTRKPPWREAREGDAWTDADDLDLQAWLQRHEIDLRSRSVVADAVERVARDRPWHPVRAYLDSLEWDGDARLSRWLKWFLGADGPDPYLAAIGSKFLVSAVARIYVPGCKVDHTLVLEGPQGVGKSSAVQILGSPWTTDSVPEFSGADAAMQLSGVWLVELAELAAMRRSEIEQVKAFLTRTEDHYRPPYGRRPVRALRQCVFFGSTNESNYLRDPTGNRRFWPVRCTDIDRDELAAVRDQLWAEARAIFIAGRQWHLTPEESLLAAEEQNERQLVTELEQEVHAYLARLVAGGVTETTTRDVLVHGCHLNPDMPDYIRRAGQLGAQAAHAMEAAGWHRVGARGRGERRRVIYRRSQGITG
jgi:predicted P-loop ATPase